MAPDYAAAAARMALMLGWRSMPSEVASVWEAATEEQRTRARLRADTLAEVMAAPPIVPRTRTVGLNRAVVAPGSAGGSFLRMCNTEGCMRTARARGLCHTCYARVYRRPKAQAAGQFTSEQEAAS